MTDRITTWRTPPQVARQLGIDVKKVLAWISTGQLRAANLAERPVGRPRWKISPDDLEAFLLERRSGAVPIKRQRLKRSPGVHQYF